MTRVICCVCQRQYGTKEDGLETVMDSHGYCERCHDEAMLAMRSEFADYPADVPAGRFA
jgi:tetraacyldisaccharide-1-P 4'-kinase